MSTAAALAVLVVCVPAGWLVLWLVGQFLFGSHEEEPPPEE